MNALAGRLTITIPFPAVLATTWKRWLPPACVALVATILALGLWRGYYSNWRSLWTDVVHDRNAHLELGLGLANEISRGHLGEVVRCIDRAKTWPPLHDGLMVGGALLLGRLDVRWAVLPSLLSYVGAAVFGFLIARRLIRTGGNLAGVATATLILISPAMRAYATDVMVEGPGAFLTLASIYAAIRVIQEDSPTSWRGLSIALSALFFLKYNYWFLMVIALAIVFVLRYHATRPIIHYLMTSSRSQRFLAPLLHPLHLAVAAIIALCVVVRVTGGTEITAFGRTFNLRSNVILASIAYWLVLLRLIPWYWRTGRQWFAARPNVAAMINWHVIPLALWLAWPQKLAYFLWVLNPWDNVGEYPATSRLAGFQYYASALATDYHVGWWSLVITSFAGLLALVCAWRRTLRPGLGVVLVFVTLAFVLTATHPNRKSRFLHSWAPAGWILAGVGIGAIARVRRPYSSTAATACTIAFVALHASGISSPPHAPEGGPHSDRPSALAIADAYLPTLAGAQRPAILCNVPLKFLARWTYLDHFGATNKVVTDVPGFNPISPTAENGIAFAKWHAFTDCDAIVLVELPLDSPWYVPVPNCAGLEQYADCLRRLPPDRFTIASSAMVDGSRVTVWRR